MNWLENYRHLFKEMPETNEIDIEQALKLLRCFACAGPLAAELRPVGENEDAWDFRCLNDECESHQNH